MAIAVAPEGFLVGLISWVLEFWSNWIGFWSWSPLRPQCDAHARRALVFRDITIVVAVGLASAAFGIWPHGDCRWLRALLGGLAIFRIIDLSLTLFRLGIFGSIRADVPLQKLPLSRVQRALLATLLNYVELLIWFALLGLWLGELSPNQFTNAVHCRTQAFFVSMSSMTTVGYGEYAPIRPLALFVATWQALLGLFMLVVIVGLLVGLAGNDDARLVAPAAETLPVGHRRTLYYFIPWFVLSATVLFVYLVLL